jgi:predicted outer membrane repeat protein
MAPRDRAGAEHEAAPASASLSVVPVLAVVVANTAPSSGGAICAARCCPWSSSTDRSKNGGLSPSWGCRGLGTMLRMPFSQPSWNGNPMKLSSLIVAAALAWSAPAVEAADDPGQYPVHIDLSSGSAFFGFRPPAGTFSHLYYFEVTQPNTVLSSTVTTVQNGDQDIDFSQPIIAGPIGGGGSTGVTYFIQIESDPYETWATTWLAAQPGQYSMILSGTNSFGRGTYAGVVSITTAVPEPESVALMFAGVGVVGFAARRRIRV